MTIEKAEKASKILYEISQVRLYLKDDPNKDIAYLLFGLSMTNSDRHKEFINKIRMELHYELEAIVKEMENELFNL